jgi:hypothetical protein
VPLKISDEQFISTWQRLQSATDVAKELEMDLRGVHRRRKSLEGRYSLPLKSASPKSPTFVRREHSPRVDCNMQEGVIVIGSDAHYWPGVISTAHKAFVNVIKELKPEIVVLNGDLFDGVKISRWPRSDWSKAPTVKEELEAVSDRLFEIKQAAGSAKIWWCLGNHDMRFETKLANQVPEFEGVKGFSFQDQFPEYPMTISLMINGNLMIKHRYHNGVHATFNNAMKSGVSMATGHLHRLQATVFSDYNGSRWGIDTGTLADTHGEHMHYGEDNPMNHCSGFAVLTIHDGQLLHPEFCSVHNEKAFFRGKQVT